MAAHYRSISPECDNSYHSTPRNQRRASARASVIQAPNARYHELQDLSHEQPMSQIFVDSHQFHRSKILTALEFVVDVFICLVPASFIVLAIAAYRLEGLSVSTYGDNIEQWALLSPTLFPIVFSAVVGKALKSAARFRLEKGSRLETLEQLMGSQTVFGTLWMQWTLRTLSFFGVALICLWLISPLGGQASLRLLSKGSQAVQNSTLLATMDKNQLSSFGAAYAQQFTLAAINAIYVGCLVAPLAIKNRPQDTWGNVKIPRFESYNQSIDHDGYASIPKGDNVDYISLIGQPVTSLTSGRDTNFTMDVLYIDMSCSDLFRVPSASDWVDKYGFNGTTAEGDSYNSSNIWNQIVDDGTFLINSDKNQQRENNTSVNFMWASKSVQGSPAPQLNYNYTSIANCTIFASQVLAYVECQGTDCRVTKAKRNGTDSNVSRWNLYTDRQTWLLWWMALARAVTTANGGVASSATEHYIFGEEESPFAPSENEGYVDMTNKTMLSKADFTRRLRRIINTYYVASLAPRASTGILAATDAQALINNNITIDGGFYSLGIQSINATTTYSHDVYRCHKVWFFAAIAASSILMATGLVGTIMKYSCRGPEVLGYVTSMIRDSPYTPLDKDVRDSTVDTSRLARSLKNLVVRLDDVQAEDATGYIAVSSLRKVSLRTSRKDLPERNYL